MTETKPRYLTERSYDPGELRFIRAQAELWSAYLKDDPTLVLVPACGRCGSDNLRDDRVNMALICEECGYVNAADVIRDGRLAHR